MGRLSCTSMGNTIAPLEAITSGAPDVLGAISKLRELPASVPVVHRALAQLEDPDFLVEDLKKVLLADAALSARILRLANSAYFGFRSEVQTVSQAVVLLGQNRIRTLLRRILADNLLLELGYARSAAAPIRKMSLVTATACCALSQLLLRDDPEELLLAGLLHNLGELFFLSRFPTDHWRACRLAETRGYREASLAVFGMTSGRAGKLLLEGWGFPPLYPAAVEYIDDPFAEGCPAGMASAIALAHVGKKLAEPFIAGLDAAEAILRIPAETCDRVGLDSELLALAYHCLPDRMSMEQLQAGRDGLA